MSLHTQQYDITGNKIGSETLVNSIPHKMYFSTWFKTVVLDNGDYVVAWSSDPTRLSEYSDSYMQIYFQRFNENGNKLGDEQQVDTANNFSFNSGREFNLAALANGGFVIGWNSSPNFENIVLARRFDANGNPELPALTGDATDNRLVFDGTQSVALLGMNGNDSLRGGSGNDSLAGGNDNDTLMGGTGNDTLAGGTGSDLYFVDSSLDVVRDSGTLSTDIDTVKSSASFTLTNNIELLILAGTAAINGTGNTLDNTITGNTANNLLNGAAGNDLLVGGYGKDTLSGGTGIDTLQGDAGSDTYILDNINDVIIETSTAMTDIDTVNAGFNYTLASTLENLTLTGSLAINATGNALNNTLTGNIKANTLYGLDGNDKLAGGAGNDTLIGGDGADKFILDSLSGIDTISDFVSNIDDVVFSASTLKVGDGDALLEGKLLRNASGGFGTSNELVIFTANITGNISNSNAAATIGSATAAMVIGEKKLFVVDNGTESNIYLFTSADGNAVVNGNELKLLATITGVNDSSTSDYLLQA
jgi:Ca2+-binding RTX toxin-like protein